MLKRLFNRVLLFFTLCIAIVVASILWKKDDFRDTFSGLDVAYLPDKYWFIDFIFGWPMILAIAATTFWVILQQFRIDSVIAKIKINALFLLGIFIIATVWLSIVYIPFYSSIG
ncbi:MAG: hypothetical protein KTR20_11525 [Cellvibrionaceae bacterium]|nr:hypothetical protein [Cellvibrionaceae bacterium]